MKLTVQDEHGDVGMYKPEPEGQDSDRIQGSETIEYTQHFQLKIKVAWFIV